MITKEIKDSIDTFCAWLAREGIDCSVICHDPKSQDLHMMGNIPFDELYHMLQQFEDAQLVAAPKFSGPGSMLG